jgi:hypothetical protein
MFSLAAAQGSKRIKISRNKRKRRFMGKPTFRIGNRVPYYTMQPPENTIGRAAGRACLIPAG